VDVVCPFIDRDGVRQLRAWAGHTKAGLRVYTRVAEAELLAAANELGWIVYAYKGTPGGDERRGFHCKFFLADEACAVVGSMNLWYHNMLENVEVGFYTEEPGHAAALADVVTSLRGASKRVAPPQTRRPH
jgi:phosphatidylserine/phosphatidylglycerophosphate/cardiolipin synthase-like enzyme